MIAELALVAKLASTPDGPGFRIAVRGTPRSVVHVRAAVPRGWIAAFCSPQVCQVGRITVRIAANGVTSLDLHMHNVANGKPGDAAVSTARYSIVFPLKS